MNAQISSHAHQGWYARFWRWHFFAALLVIPFVIWQSVTGILYIWHQEYEKVVHADQMIVTPHTTRVSYQAQLDTALAYQSGKKVNQLVIPADSTQATQVFFTTDSGLNYPAFVNPYTGEYLGDIAPARWLAGITRSLHGGWPIEPYGSYLLELGDGWALVMVLTGLYLWWPRTPGLAGVLYPRLKQGKRIFWRDLHAVIAVYVSAVVVVFLITALPWTSFWGNNVLKPIEHALHQRAPSEEFFRSGGSHGAHQGHMAGHAAMQTVTRAPLDAFIDQARANGATGELIIRLRGNGPIVNLRDRHPHASDEAYFKLDAATGALISKATWQDFGFIPKLVALGVDLHEGSLFGRANQIVNTVMSLGLIWLSITGIVLWVQRRPAKSGLAAPAKRPLNWTPGLKITAVTLCVVMPLLGASVLAITTLDKLFGRRLAV